MADELEYPLVENVPLADLVNQVRFTSRHKINFKATSTRGVQRIVARVVDAAFCFNLMSISRYGGRSGREREPGLLENAVGAAFQTFAGFDPHPGFFQKAAMLMRGITHGHPFQDGNKRTGFMTAMYYLEQVGYPPLPDMPVDEVVEFCFAVSAGEIEDVDVITCKLCRFWGYPLATCKVQDSCVHLG